MKLKLYLVENRITVTDFSKELGVTRNYLSGIINGKLKCGKYLAQIIEMKTNGKIKAEELANVKR